MFASVLSATAGKPAADATVYRSEDDVREIGKDGDLLGEDVVPGFRVALRELFPADSPG